MVDLKGRVVGITMARADRTRSFVMPSAAIMKLIEAEPQDPSLAKVRTPEVATPMAVGRMAAPQGEEAPQPGSEDRLRRHLTEMQRLMDFMREEMDNLGDGR